MSLGGFRIHLLAELRLWVHMLADLERRHMCLLDLDLESIYGLDLGLDFGLSLLSFLAQFFYIHLELD